MHDTEFFKKLVENIVMWSFVIPTAKRALRSLLPPRNCIGYGVPV